MMNMDNMHGSEELPLEFDSVEAALREAASAAGVDYDEALKGVKSVVGHLPFSERKDPVEIYNFKNMDGLDVSVGVAEVGREDAPKYGLWVILESSLSVRV